MNANEEQAGGIMVTGSMIESLRSTKPWVKLLSVLGFISIGFMILIGIGFIVFSNMIPGQKGAPPAVGGLIYLVMSLLYLFPTLHLYRYSSAIGKFLNSNAKEDMELALMQQKSFWKFIGIMTLITFVLGVLAIGAAIMIPMLMKVRQPV